MSLVRRAALVHDVGRVAVHPRIWQKPGPLTADEWEQVRLHAYHTERVLDRGPFLAALGRVAGAHHERLDGSGYHRNSTAASLPPTARLLATADAFSAICAARSASTGASRRIALRHSAITLALDAGIGLRDVQDFARHTDPKATRGYDRSRNQLNRHATYAIAQYLRS